MRDTLYPMADLRSIVAAIAAKHEPARVCLFGSCARGDATGNSDADLRADKGRLKAFCAGRIV